MNQDVVVPCGEFMNPEQFELEARKSYFIQDLRALPELSGLIAARRLLSFTRGSVKIIRDGTSWILCHSADGSAAQIARVIDIIEVYVPGQLLVRMECDNCRQCPTIEAGAGASFPVPKGDRPANELFAIVNAETTSFTRLHLMRESVDQLVFQCVW